MFVLTTVQSSQGISHLFLSDRSKGCENGVEGCDGQAIQSNHLNKDMSVDVLIFNAVIDHVNAKIQNILRDENGITHEIRPLIACQSQAQCIKLDR